jgi:tetratricopeptide (TPR) repeat protein
LKKSDPGRVLIGALRTLPFAKGILCGCRRLGRFKVWSIPLVGVFVLATSCAIPRDNTTFSLSRPGLTGEEEVFASSKDLRVAGLVSEGLSFANNGRLFNAEGRLRQAYYLEPTNDRIAFNLAIIANQSGESDEALAMMEALLAKEPRNPHYLQALADVWEAQGEHEMAKVKLKEAFSIFKSAGNAPRAALVARSISNIAFGVGNEQEALCYSYEAFSLSPTPPQVSAHARLLVGLNFFDQAIEFVRANKPIAGEPAAFHALAMALFAKGDSTAALEAEDNAVGRISQAPELSQEINTAWLLMKARVPMESTVSSDWDEKMAELQEGATQFAERPPYELVMWPAELRQELVKATTPS